MQVLSWGECTITHAISVNGYPADAWGGVDTPKEDTTKLSTIAGGEHTANKEGGGTVDARLSRNGYQLEFDIFVKKGRQRPFSDDDGRIVGEHAFRIMPEGEGCEGIQIDRCQLRVEERYSTAEGKMLHYVARVLKPAEGKMVKPWTGAKYIRLYTATAMRLVADGNMRLS
jgi:hypothetical protein